MQDSMPVRKHRSLAQREEILRNYHRSQITQKEFAQQIGISVSTLQAWLRKAPGHGVADAPAFVPVPNLLAASPLPPAYRLQWPGGLSLEVRAGFVAQELAALLQLLPAL